MRLLPILLLFSAITGNALAQDPFAFRYDTRDGLPSSETYDVVQDTDGYIWCSTDRGVCRYDGYGFATYTTQQGLSSNTIYKLKTDRHGKLWALTSDGDLGYLKDQGFQMLGAGGLQQLSLGHAMTKVLFDAGNNPVVYAWANELLITDSKIRYEPEHIDPPKVYVWSNGKFQPQSCKIIRYYSNPADSLKLSLCFDGGNDALLWASKLGFVTMDCRNGQKGIYFCIGSVLYYWDFERNKLQVNTRHLHERIQALKTDRNGNLWVATRTGAYQYLNGTIETQPRHFFAQYNFTGMVQDREGNYWFSIWNGGLLMVPSFDFRQVALLHTPASQRILSLKVFKDLLFVGTSENMLLTVNENMQSRVLFDNNTPERPNELIEYIDVADGKLWCTGGHHFDVNNGKVIELPRMAFSTRFVYRLKNGYWINGIPMNSMQLFGFAQNRFVVRQVLMKRRIFSLLEDRYGKLWLGTGDGLVCVEGYDYAHAQKLWEQHDFLGGRISDIKSNPSGSLLAFATRNNGLTVKYGNSFYHYNNSAGLLSNHINRVLFQNDSLLWVCSNRGLTRLIFSVQSKVLTLKACEHFTISDGLLSNFVSDVAIWNNNLFIATNAGLNVVALNTVRAFARAPIIPDLYLRTDDSVYQKGRQPLRLSYANDYIELGFTGICFRKPESASFYRYRLQGLGADSAWKYTADRSVHFVNIPPGEYVFEVQAQNKNGVMSALAVFPFIITPHFTQTWWFVLLIALAVAAIVAAVFYMRLNAARRKTAIRTQLKEAELKWKQAELDALRNQMNPHFVYNSLNSIQNFIFKNDTDKVNDYIARFSRLMRNSLEYSRLEFISLQEEMEFIENYLFLEKMRFDQRFDYQVSIDEAIRPASIFVPPLMLQPVLENCIKHAFRNMTVQGHIRIDIGLSETVGHIRVVVSDNGCGLDAAKATGLNGKKQSLGLEIIRKRLELLKERYPITRPSFNIYSATDEKHRGTIAEFNLPFETIWE